MGGLGAGVVFETWEGSLWCAKTPSICSWSWHKILQLKDKIRPFIKHRVYKGKVMQEHL